MGDLMPGADEHRKQGMILANVDAAALWDGQDGDDWTTYEDRYTRTLKSYNVPLFAGAHISTTDRVLDVGCGTGETTRMAAHLAPAGRTFGVDLSARMIQRARERSRMEGLTNVSFEQADAQVYPFTRETFDVAISRFGIMFFNDPVAAFTNIGHALRPGGRVALLAWQEFQKNEWVLAFRDALAMGRSLPVPAAGVPGPFALSDASLVQRILTDAGFVDVHLDDVTGSNYLGVDADDAFAFARVMGVARGLLEDLSDEDKARGLTKMRAILTARDHGKGVEFGSSAWLITAYRP